MVSAAPPVSLLRKFRSHSPGQLFSLSLVEVEDGWSRFPLSKAGQLIQRWWLPGNFSMAQSWAACYMRITGCLVGQWLCLICKSLWVVTALKVFDSHYVPILEVFLIEQAAWILGHSKVTRKPPLLDELTSFGQRESAPAILGLY